MRQLMLDNNEAVQKEVKLVKDQVISRCNQLKRTDENLERSCKELDERINQHTYQISNQLTSIESNKLRLKDIETNLESL